MPILIRNGPSNAAFFILREEATAIFPRQHNLVYQGGLEFFTGACIGAFVSSIFYPLNVLKVVMQCRLGGPNENMFKVFNNIYVERGSSLRNVYRGGNFFQ